MSTNLKDALKGAGVTRDVVKKVPRNKAEWLAYHGLTEKPPRPSNNTRPQHVATAKPNDGGVKYIVLPFAKLHDGSVFVPIEKMGKTFYYNKKAKQVTFEDGTIGVALSVEHLSERKWAITRDLFIKDSNARSMSLTTGKDAIFALTDWCIVKVK
jgi:hypothetical protein